MILPKVISKKVYQTLKLDFNFSKSLVSLLEKNCKQALNGIDNIYFLQITLKLLSIHTFVRVIVLISAARLLDRLIFEQFYLAGYLNSSAGEVGTKKIDWLIHSLSYLFNKRKKDKKEDICFSLSLGGESLR